MKTIIQFADHNPVRNVVGCKLTLNDTVYFCGDKKLVDTVLPDYERFLEYRFASANVKPFYIDTDNVEEVMDKLEKLILDNPKCVIDVSGGKDLYLYAVGRIVQKLKDIKNIQVQLVDSRNGKIVDIDGDDRVEESNVPFLTIAENIILRGGRIIESSKFEISRDHPDDSMCDDIETMWEITRKYGTLWNSFKDVIERHKINVPGEERNNAYIVKNSVFSAMGSINGASNDDGTTSLTKRQLYNELVQAGMLIQELLDKNNEPGKPIVYRITCKNDFVKKCMDMCGTPLELQTYLAALRYKVDGEYFFIDVRTGVKIEWDDRKNYIDCDKPSNEVDVIASSGFDCYFISCKNGKVDKNELYLLNAVSTKFGGIATKKVLIASDLSIAHKEPRSKNKFKDEAKALGIDVFDNVKKKNMNSFFNMFDKIRINKDDNE